MPCKRAQLKVIGGRYRSGIIEMPGFLRAERKGAVLLGGGKKVRFKMTQK